MNITRFPGVVPTAGEARKPDPIIVEMLEQVLEDARNGMIVAVGIATVRPAGRTRHRWSGGDAWGHHLMASCTYLHHDIAATSREWGEDVERETGDSA